MLPAREAPAYGGGAPVAPTPTPAAQRVHDRLQTLRPLAAAIGSDLRVDAEAQVGDDVAATILARASSPDIGFVVLGTHARTGLARAFRGSVAEAVARRCPTPVLVVPARERAAGGASCRAGGSVRAVEPAVLGALEVLVVRVQRHRAIHGVEGLLAQVVDDLHGRVQVQRAGEVRAVGRGLVALLDLVERLLADLQRLLQQALVDLVERFPVLVGLAGEVLAVRQHLVRRHVLPRLAGGIGGGIVVLPPVLGAGEPIVAEEQDALVPLRVEERAQRLEVDVLRRHVGAEGLVADLQQLGLGRRLAGELRILGDDRRDHRRRTLDVAGAAQLAHQLHLQREVGGRCRGGRAHRADRVLAVADALELGEELGDRHVAGDDVDDPSGRVEQQHGRHRGDAVLLQRRHAGGVVLGGDADVAGERGRDLRVGQRAGEHVGAGAVVVLPAVQQRRLGRLLGRRRQRAGEVLLPPFDRLRARRAGQGEGGEEDEDGGHGRRDESGHGGDHARTSRGRKALPSAQRLVDRRPEALDDAALV
ncbi:MAG: universal stress protein [Planctomycetota bacterium]